MNLILLSKVEDFIDILSDEDSAKILSHLRFLETGKTEALEIKPLKDKIRELIINQYRIIFFAIGDNIYAVDSFKKQSQKTPKRIIERAEKIYKTLSKKDGKNKS